MEKLESLEHSIKSTWAVFAEVSLKMWSDLQGPNGFWGAFLSAVTLFSVTVEEVWPLNFKKKKWMKGTCVQFFKVWYYHKPEK